MLLTFNLTMFHIIIIALNNSEHAHTVVFYIYVY